MSTFTLLIPTYDRAPFLRRLLTHYESEKFSYPISIADSSDPAAFEENRDTVASCRSLNITHRAFDPSADFFEKITGALHAVDTFSVGLCSDDDFLSAHAPHRASKFLKKHPSYSVVEGRSFVAEPTPKGMYISAYPQHKVAEAAPDTRIESYFKNPSSNFYAIYRTRVLKDILARIGHYRTHNTRFEELGVSILGAISGNVAVLPTLHMVRQSSRGRADSGSQQTVGWRAVAEAPSFSEDRERFIDMLGDALREHGTEGDVARDLLAHSFDNYLSQSIGAVKSAKRISFKERAVAAALFPAKSASSVRKMGSATLMGISARLRALRRECMPIVALIEKYPDGIPKHV